MAWRNVNNVAYVYTSELGRVRARRGGVQNPPPGTCFLIFGMTSKSEDGPNALFDAVLGHLQTDEVGETWLAGPGESPISCHCQSDFEAWLTTHPELTQQDGRRIQVIAP